MIKVNDTEAVMQWTRKVFFPTDQYTLRCIDAEFGNSNTSGRPMVTLTWEILNCAPKRVGDRTYEFDGVEVKQYLHSLDEAAGQATMSDALKSLGWTEDGWDETNPPLEFFRGKVAEIVVEGRKQPMVKSLTPEQKAKKMKPSDGDKIIDPITKQPLVQWQPNIQTIIGLSTVSEPAF